ncbi:MAG: hypothetical protein HRU35_08155 [Rickettsiaceae bacterium]|nr:hypothetical protein [Rickettsiaceae bacterium]
MFKQLMNNGRVDLAKSILVQLGNSKFGISSEVIKLIIKEQNKDLLEIVENTVISSLHGDKLLNLIKDEQLMEIVSSEHQFIPSVHQLNQLIQQLSGNSPSKNDFKLAIQLKNYIPTVTKLAQNNLSENLQKLNELSTAVDKYFSSCLLVIDNNIDTQIQLYYNVIYKLTDKNLLNKADLLVHGYIEQQVDEYISNDVIYLILGIYGYGDAIEYYENNAQLAGLGNNIDQQNDDIA